MLVLNEVDLNYLRKEDFQNLINMGEIIGIRQDDGRIVEHDSQKLALERLQHLQDIDDRTAKETIEVANIEDDGSEDKEIEIKNPNPLHNQRGFEKWMNVVELNASAQDVKVSELTNEYTKEEIEAAVVELT